MKIKLFGLVLLSLPIYAEAEINVYSEALIGKANNELYAKDDFDGSKRASSAMSDSFGLRLGFELTEQLALEISKHHHGEAPAEYTVHRSTTIPGSNEGPFTTSYNVGLPIDTESLRLGVKGKIALSNKVNANIRVGIAHWKYKDVIPAQLVSPDNTGSGDSGNDIYTAVGFNYQLTDNLYAGLEYALINIKESQEYDYGGNVKYEHNLHELSIVLGWAF